MRLRGQANIQVRGEVRRGTLQDIGPGGCLVIADEPLVRGAAVRVCVVGEGIPEPLAGAGRVAWTRSAITGIEFAPEAILGADAWLQRVAAEHPRLRPPSIPRELPWGAPLFVSPWAPPGGLAPDEASVLRAAEPGVATSVLVRRCGLAEARAARAIFGLLEKGALSLVACIPPPLGAAARPRPRAPAPEARALAPRAAERELLVGADGSQRPSAAQTLLDAARATAEAGRIGAAIPLLREALQLAPGDAEIANTLQAIAFGPRERWSAAGVR